MISYKEYLYKMGDALGVYATIERLAVTKTHTSSLSISIAEVVDEDVSSIDALVTKLNKEIEGVTIVRSDVDPAVIHLIEAALLKNDAYPMEQQVTLEYTGTLNGLLERLHEQLPSIGPSTRGGIPTQTQDYTTQTSVDESDEVVRKILTDAVAVEGYGHILFEAITYDLNGSPQVEVNYFGPKQNP